MENFMMEKNKEIGKQGQELNTVGLPTQIEILSKAHIQKKKQEHDTKLKNLLEKYGGSKHLKVPEVIKHV
jgi:hypothetical protein